MSAIAPLPQQSLLQQLSPPEWRQLLDLLERFETLADGAERLAWVERLTKAQPLQAALLAQFGAVQRRASVAGFLRQPTMSVACMRQCVDAMAQASRHND